jgi:hypothetical protein
MPYVFQHNLSMVIKALYLHGILAFIQIAYSK